MKLAPESVTAHKPTKGAGGGSVAQNCATKAETLGADGVATINGVAGWYSCDGGCDKATIGSEFAKILEEQRTELVPYKTPLNATLIDGSTGPNVTHYLVADVVLTTKAGEVVLPRTHIDVLSGPEQNR